MSVTVTELAARHEAVIKGLAEIAGFIRSHPDLPLADPSYGDPFLVYVVSGTDEGKQAEVRRIAGILGVSAEFVQPGQYAAIRRFSGGVTYRVFALGSRHRGADARPLAAVGAAA